MRWKACSLAFLFLCSAHSVAWAAPGAAVEAQTPPAGKPKIAAIVSLYTHNSHADVIVSRLLQTDTLDGKGRVSPLELASLYVDQKPEKDKSVALAKEFGFRQSATLEDALTLGTGKLAVDGVLLVMEHGKYPLSDTGQIAYPKRAMFEKIVKVFKDSGRVVPVFVDKHLSDNWTDAKWIFDTAKAMKIPLMAGSSLPTTWRHPAVDVDDKAKLKEVVVVSFHLLDVYGFHAMEIAQTLVERQERRGIKAVRCLSGDAVWKAMDDGAFDAKLLEAALDRMPRKIPRGEALRKAVKEPVLFTMEYRDGLRAHVITLNPVVGEWTAAWRYEERVGKAKDDKARDDVESTYFWTLEERPLMHFTWLVNGFEQMVLTGKPAWPAERTLVTSGALDALLRSKKDGGKRIETPELEIRYELDWRWKQSPPPPKGRPLGEQ